MRSRWLSAGGSGLMHGPRCSARGSAQDGVAARRATPAEEELVRHQDHRCRAVQ